MMMQMMRRAIAMAMTWTAWMVIAAIVRKTRLTTVSQMRVASQ